MIVFLGLAEIPVGLGHIFFPCCMHSPSPPPPSILDQAPRIPCHDSVWGYTLEREHASIQEVFNWLGFV